MNFAEPNTKLQLDDITQDDLTKTVEIYQSLGFKTSMPAKYIVTLSTIQEELGRFRSVEIRPRILSQAKLDYRLKSEGDKRYLHVQFYPDINDDEENISEFDRKMREEFR